MLSLTIINSDNICSSFPLEPTPGSVYRIGRSTDCEIALPEEIHLSRVHCILTVGEGCALLTDNNSSNGIFEDDARVQEILMLPGKQYRAGNCKLMLEYTADAPAEEYQEPTYQEEPTPVYEEEPATVYEEPAPAYVEEPATVYEEPTPAYVEEPATVYEEPTPQPIELEPEPVVELIPEPEEEPQPAPAIPPVPESAPPPPAKPRRKFVVPPPRKPLVKRPTPRPFYTAAGKLNTETTVAAPKELKRRRSTNGVKVRRAASTPADALGLPNDFDLSLRLLNTTETLEEGDLLRFSLIAEESCHVFLIQYDSTGNAVMLVPGVGGADNKLPAIQETQFPPTGADSPYELYVEPPFGTDTIIAVACTQPTDFLDIWKDCLAQADALTTPGDVEKKAIELCKEDEDASNALWSSALLYLKTGS
ncbi:MAG: DUF4384 domain-containing protein [Akkermansia sp.]|nr:DUF4384 domain-containing protein [Akkermansia sp.]